MTNNLVILGNLLAYYGDDNVLVGNGNFLTIDNTGDSRIVTPNTSFYLMDVLHASNLGTNLIYVQHFLLKQECTN